MHSLRAMGIRNSRLHVSLIEALRGPEAPRFSSPAPSQGERGPTPKASGLHDG